MDSRGKGDKGKQEEKFLTQADTESEQNNPLTIFLMDN